MLWLLKKVLLFTNVSGGIAGAEQGAGQCRRASLGETVALTHLCVLIMEKCAFRLRQGTVILLSVAIVFPCAHQSLLLSNCFLLEDAPHEVPFVHRGPDDFQVVRVDDYLPKIYNRWRLEKRRVGVSSHQTQGGRSCPMPFPKSRRKGFCTHPNCDSSHPKTSFQGLFILSRSKKSPFPSCWGWERRKDGPLGGQEVEISVQSICSHCPPGQPVQSWAHAKGLFHLI